MLGWSGRSIGLESTWRRQSWYGQVRSVEPRQESRQWDAFGCTIMANGLLKRQDEVERSMTRLEGEMFAPERCTCHALDVKRHES